MPETDAALMTAFLHRANPERARKAIAVQTSLNQPNMWSADHSFGRNRETA
ncbi:hypothetical protein [Tardiphaga sp.]|jgi:hypothetical protein|uniref:hypothetical protein n=1 Tax=Tardiphaga sp. TaxID=1926292 RepID=UPI0037DA0D59